jgi:hypothetical protein
MYGVRFLSLLLVLVLANSFLNDSGGERLEFDPVAAAAERTQKCPGMRFSLYVVYSTPALPEPVTATGSGAYNGKTDRTRLTLELTSPVRGPLRLIQISEGDVNYQSGELVEDKLPAGKTWVRSEESDDLQEDETPLNVEDSLRMLSSSGGFKVVGRESINGKSTRRYRGEIQLGELIDFLRGKGKDAEAEAYEEIAATSPTTISAEGWVDRKNMLRRFRMVLPMAVEAGEPAMTVDMRMDFFDYGAEPDIQLPDPATVAEAPLDEAASSGAIS